MTKIVFNEYHLAGDYMDNDDCPYHRAISEKIISGTHLRVAGCHFSFDHWAVIVDFTDEMLAVGHLLSAGEAEPGLTVEVPIPEEYLRAEPVILGVGENNHCGWYTISQV